MLRAEVEENPFDTIEELSMILVDPTRLFSTDYFSEQAGVWVPHNLRKDNKAERSTTRGLLFSPTQKYYCHNTS